MSQPRSWVTVRWRKYDDDPDQWHVADLSDPRDADRFADWLLSTGSVDPESIQLETKINKPYR